jgi:hypothetical protein
MDIQQYRHLFDEEEWEVVSELPTKTQRNIVDGKLALCDEKGVDDPKDMKYIGGHQNPMTHISEEARLLQYNVMRIGHRLHKSTVAFKSGWGE